MRIPSLILFMLCVLMARADIGMSFSADPAGVSLGEATILIDTKDSGTVATVARHFADDVALVTGSLPEVRTKLPKGVQIVIAGTCGGNRWIDRLAESGRLDIAEIAGQPERFVIKTVEAPFKGIDRAIVVAGSDRRAVAYGLFTLSEEMGVSPWYWWADVPVERHDAVSVKADFTSKAPSVAWRGIFINDEDWGLKPWSSFNYEKELGDIGPRTYARVCELLLRLKGNMLAPAMHTCTGAFYTHPESKKVADDYGIMITTSHCEPVGFNNACKAEWDTGKDGEWNYMTNRDAIYAKLDARVKETAPYGNIYTLAMRGLHDEGMRGDMTPQQKVENLTRAITDQRGMISRHVKGRSIEEIPQIFVPYKEALEIYELGLEVPDEVTLVWVDDNYGYMKRLSNPEEKKRKGRSGVYYHTSYLGAPHDYLWLNTTPPALMYEELRKAYVNGADRYWLLNVGDIKPMETAMMTFFDMAWDMNRFSYDNINRHQAAALGDIYGHCHTPELQSLLDGYYRLAWSRKPEFMGWEREWDQRELEDLRDTEYSFDNHNDARRRLAEYDALAIRAGVLMESLPEQYRPSFFEMVAFPIMAANQQNRKFMLAQLNHELAARGDMAGANWAALQSKAAFDSIEALHARYNSLLSGKWNYMMNHSPAFCAKHHLMPSLTEAAGVAPREVDILPQAAQDIRSGFYTIDLGKPSEVTAGNVRTLEGIGYDWLSLQLGEASDKVYTSVSTDAPRATYTFGPVDTDSVEITVWTLPFFPLYKGVGTQIAVAVDGSGHTVISNRAKEYSPEWKTDVLRNGTSHTMRFAVDPSLPAHTVSLTGINPGMIVQRVIIDHGGLRPTYVGPSI
ncbi:MAG: hypothetical protein HFJ91_09060 [Muribaculaceae bacterium]|nr:hypothetical protein [Muribaculaceae bacterium]